MPTPPQQNLLRAALLTGCASLDSWTRWKSEVDFDSLDEGSQRLLPMLYTNLHAQGVDDALMGRLKGYYRMTWYKNKLLFHKIETILRAFHEAGIPTILLKGAALTLQYYRDYGLRPMRDFDVLVPEQSIPRAHTVLESLGWHSKDRKTLEQLEFDFTISHSAAPYMDGEGSEFDLHTRIGYYYWRYVPHDVWEGAIPLQLNGIETLALNPAEQLIHVCVHGLAANQVPPLRWIADAAVLLRSEPHLDWTRLVSYAREAHLEAPVYTTLTYLQTLLNLEFPVSAMRALESAPVSREERLRLYVATHPINLTSRVVVHYDRYANLRRGTNTPLSLIGILRYFQQLWQIEQIWQVPIQGLRRILDLVLTSRNNTPT